MLRKRSRSIQKDQYKGHLMPDSASESCFQPDVLGPKHKNSSFFGVTGLFVGFTSKGISDSDSAKSPTSPLDYKVLSNLGNPFRSPRSCSEGSQKSWDCNKVGLSIVDSLNDETNQSGKILGQSESKNILFGSQLKINIPNSQTHLYGSNDSYPTPKSLPKNYVVTPNALLKSPRLRLGSSEIIFETGETQLEHNPFEKIQPCLSNSGSYSSSLTGIRCHNPNLSSEDFCSDKKTARVGSPPLIVGGPNLNNSLGLKPSLLSMSIGSASEFLGSLSASDIELSEDYTCVISHGPNPRTTHIFGDCILECHTHELANCCKKDEQGTGSPQAVKCSDGSALYPPDGFLSFCYTCKKKLEEGKDIYIYRGEKAFCSCDCRSQEILVEEEMEKTLNNSSEDSPKSTDHEELFVMGMVVAT